MSTQPTATVLSLDHLVLTVHSLKTTIDFYTTHMGMTHTSFTPPRANASDPPPQSREALHFGTQKINLHERGKEFEPKAGSARPGSADLCFLVSEKVDDVLARLKDGGVEILVGARVVERTGAQGRIRSVYFRDPDGNLIELSNLVEKS